MSVPKLNTQHIVDLYRARGAGIYVGEVSHLMHAWQCGQLAYFAEADPSLQLACWLHDIGHLVTSDPIPGLSGDRSPHEELGADWLEQHWGPAVAEPVRLHVKAERYLVSRYPSFRNKLSVEALANPAWQGGDMSADECAEFERAPHYKAALLLRVWDEQAKQPDWFAPSRHEALRQLSELIDHMGR